MAAALVIGIAVVLLGAILYSCRSELASSSTKRWHIGRRSVDTTQTASIASCSSWHVYPEHPATSIGGCSGMVLDSALTHAIGMPPAYIPYRGPIEPPPLPYPEKTAWRERDLPPVPPVPPRRPPLIMEDNLLGLSFDSDDWRASIPPRYDDAPSNTDSWLLTSPAITGRAQNAHRSVARLLPLTASTDSGGDTWPWSGSPARPSARNTLPALPVAVVRDDHSPRRNADRISVRNYSLSAVPGAYRDVLRCRASAPPVPCSDQQSPPAIAQVQASRVSMIQPSVA